MTDVVPDPTASPTKIERGLATTAGLGASGSLGLLGLIITVANGDATSDTWKALKLAVITLAVTQGGRYLQAAVAIVAQALAKRVPAAPAPAVIVTPPAASITTELPGQVITGTREAGPAYPPDTDDGAHELTDGDPAQGAEADPEVAEL